jgi:(p)ppGpp synthase/HD superfamily hydrolase
MDALHKMIILATESHCGQKDITGKPYILHPLWVMNMLAKTHSDIDLLCIAVGQGLLEDTDVTVDILKANGFNARVIDAIVTLTRVEGQTYTEYRESLLSSRDASRVKFYSLSHLLDTRRYPNLTEFDLVKHKQYKALRDIIRSSLSDDRLIASP